MLSNFFAFAAPSRPTLEVTGGRGDSPTAVCPNLTKKVQRVVSFWRKYSCKNHLCLLPRRDAQKRKGLAAPKSHDENRVVRWEEFVSCQAPAWIECDLTGMGWQVEPWCILADALFLEVPCERIDR